MTSPMYGRHRYPFGGVDKAKPETSMTRKDDTMEPSRFFNMPVTFYDELIHSEGLTAVIFVGAAPDKIPSANKC